MVTRKHSSRMCTAHLLTVSCSIRWGRGVCPTVTPPECKLPLRCRPPPPVDRRNGMLVKIFPRPKLRLRTEKKFGYNEHPLITSSFFYISLLVVSRTQCTCCKWDPVYSLLAGPSIFLVSGTQCIHCKQNPVYLL